MSVVYERLETIKKRYLELGELLLAPETLRDNRLLAKLAKEQAGLEAVVSTYEELLACETQIEATQQLHNETDEDIREMAALELAELNDQKEEYLARLEVLLIPKDPNDNSNTIIEIRGAAGGDEGNIFAGDLYRMYSKYAEEKGWKIEIIEASEGEAGGFTLISFLIKGNEVYKELKFESGAHRVQRVPKTESQGRIHTSTATVLAMPDVEDSEVEINPADLVIDTHRSSGAGGQHINKTDSAVRITHIPTGISVNCQDGRSQHDNKDTALRLIRARIYEQLEREKEEAAGAVRKVKIGSGDRSEKIRTYNYPQNRVTDHRIGLTINQLDRIMEGKLQDIIEALLQEEQRAKLAGEIV